MTRSTSSIGIPAFSQPTCPCISDAATSRIRFPISGWRRRARLRATTQRVWYPPPTPSVEVEVMVEVFLVVVVVVIGGPTPGLPEAPFRASADRAAEGGNQAG